MGQVIGATVSLQIGMSAAAHGARTAFVFPAEDLRLGFAELDARTDQAARALLALGLRRGSRIGLWSVNTSRWLVTALAAAKIGVVFVPINTSYRRFELDDVITRSQIDCLFAQSRLAEDALGGDPLAVDGLTGGRVGGGQTASCKGVVWLDGQAADAPAGWEAFLAGADRVGAASLAAAKAEVRPEHDYVVQYTSGTTARPKGAVLTHRSVLSAAAAFGQVMRLSPTDVTCVPLPLFHCYGNVLTLLGGLIRGSATVYLEHFRARETLDVLERERCTAFMGVPTMYLALVDADGRGRRDLSALRKGGIGGACCPPGMTQAIAAELDMDQLTVGYGLSEASALCLISPVDAPAHHRLRTTGFPIPGLEARILDRATGRAAPPGVVGELLVRGPGVMSRYLDAPEATAAVIDPDGWLHTGDLAKRSPDGSYKFAGRVKDIIIRAGENISPTEIEEVLLELPRVRDCQCVGVPDRLRGEEIACCLITTDGSRLDPGAVRDHVARRLARFKVPKHVLTLPAFPLNAAGKVARDRLARVAAAAVASSGIAESSPVSDRPL
ncbi:MAG: AMP-binding protein [Bifidobacteriaceae bacterium]|jgi:fatty-acyl-CoA synthase|nr:AMP-binding protein [Bifidobacteriaceae bacterium]